MGHQVAQDQGTNYLSMEQESRESSSGGGSCSSEWGVLEFFIALGKIAIIVIGVFAAISVVGTAVLAIYLQFFQ